MSKGKGLQANRWHVNRETGDVGLCNATVRTCPYGGETGVENHYASKKEAQEIVEEFFDTLYDGALPDTAKKVLVRNRNRMVFDAQPTAEAADFTDELVAMKIPAKISGSSVSFPLLSKNAEKPGDEYGDLMASAKYIDSGRNEGKWIFSAWTPQNSWYGSARLLHGSDRLIIDKKEVVAEVRKLMKDPEVAVRKLQNKDTNS